MGTNKESNELIAKFMGYELITPEMRNRPETWSTSYWQKDYPNKQDVLASEHQEMAYHISWEWLMPVVEYIEHIKGVTVILKTNTACEIFHFGKLIYRHNGQYSKFMGIYNGVTEFIKYYNTKKLSR